LKVLHVPYSFPPDPPGGTEIYVDGLCRVLTAHGIESVVAAPAGAQDSYEIDGIPVRRFACSDEALSLDALYGGGDPIATVAFTRVLDEERPDILHMHAISPACSIDLVMAARERAIPVVVTYHTPAISCQRGTMLKMGAEQCSGVLGVEPCTECVLDDLGVNPVMRHMVSAVPSDLGRAIGRQGWSGGVWTAMRMTALMERRIADAKRLFEAADLFVSLTPWVTRLLAANDVPSERIVYSPHGTAGGHIARGARSQGDAIRLIHLGRLDPVKGTALLLRALAAAPELPLMLDIFGIVQGTANAGLVDTLRSLADADPRVTLRPSIAHDRVQAALSEYDAVVVPSQWAETGPLVVLEAFAARIPVIGSALGGIADKIDHERNGLLVSPFHSEAAWTATLARVTSRLDLLPRLREGVVAPRSMVEVGCEMRDAYVRLTTRRAAPLVGSL
jgi:glycosyltransferase involved in cell wall biosynthesis